MKPEEYKLRDAYSPVNCLSMSMSRSLSPTRNRDILKEVNNLKHELHMKQCEHHHKMSTMKINLNRMSSLQTFQIMRDAEVEKYQLDFEVRRLEEELIARRRFAIAEHERGMVRIGINAKEIENLQHTLDQTIRYINRTKEQLVWEMDGIRRDGANMKLDLKSSYDKRVADMREEFEYSCHTQNKLIQNKEKEFAEIENDIKETKYKNKQAIADLHDKVDTRK